MSNSDKLIAALADAPGPVCDDCASVKAKVFPRQQINQIAGRLSLTGRVARSTGTPCCYCHAAKTVSSLRIVVSNSISMPDAGATRTAPAPPSPSSPSFLPVKGGDSTRPWHWEGNIQGTLAEYLESTGWTITAFANTSRKEAGIDLAASRLGEHLVVEVKGYPSSTYDHGQKRGLPKPTRATNQARQWYSHALLSAMRLLEKYPKATVAMCFPDRPTYRALISATLTSLTTLGLVVFLISEKGHVSEHVR